MGVSTDIYILAEPDRPGFGLATTPHCFNFMKKFAVSGLAAALLLLFVGCASKPTIAYDLSPEVDVAAFETFALMPLPKRVSGGRPGAVERYGPIVQEAMRNALTAKGYTEVDSLEEADFALNIKAAISPRLNVSQWGYTTGRYAGTDYWGMSSYYEVVADVDVRPDDHRIVVMEIYENDQKTLAWCSWSIDKARKQAPTEEGINTLISDMLASFPAN